MSKLKKLFTLALVALGIAALAPSAAAAYYPEYFIETDNAFDTYYNPFAKPINIQNWLWDLTRHHHWTNSIGYFSTSTGKTCDMSTTGFKKFWQQGNWLLGTDTFCTSNYPSPGTLVLKTIKPAYEKAPYVETTCLDNIKSEAAEKMPEATTDPGDFSDDEVQALLTVGVCELFRQHESKYDPITKETRTTNAAFMSNLVDQVVQVPSINTNRYSTYHMSSWQCGQRLDMNSFRPGEKYLDFNRSEHTVSELIDFAANHYGHGIDECLKYLTQVSDNWEGSCLLPNRTNEQAMAENTAWRWFDEDVYLDRADVKMLQFFCYMSKVLLLVPKMYEVTGDTKEEKDQLYDIQEYFFSDSKGPIHYDPEMIHNDRTVGTNVWGTWFWPKAAIPRQYYFDKNPENRPYDTFLYGSRVEKCFWAILQRAPRMFASIDDEEAAAEAKDAFTKALACYLDADAFITSKWPSATGTNWGGQRDDKQQHLIELDFDGELEAQPGDASVAYKGNAAAWRQLIQTLYKSMTAEGGTTAQDLDLNTLGKKFLMRHKGELVDFSGLGANKDGVVQVDACSVFTGALCRTMLKDTRAVGLYTNETLTLQGYIVGLYTNRVDGGKMYSRTNWYPVVFNNVNTRFTVTEETVDKTLGGLAPAGTAIDDLRTMANRYSMTARGTTEFAQHFYDERAVIKAGQSTNLVENKTYTAAPADKNGGAFLVTGGATLTGTNVTFADNQTTQSGGAIFNSNGTVSFDGVTFEGNKALLQGGAISCSGGTLSLGGVTFEGNKALQGGGAIGNNGTVHFDGPVTLVTETDTIHNKGTLNWNLADGKAGFLGGYQNITNVGAKAKLQLTVEDYAAMPTNVVIATGDFSNIDDKNTFSITNATLGGGMATAKINGGFTGIPGSLLGYKLFTEEDLASGTTNLVLHIEEHYTCEREVINDDDTKTLEEGKTYTALPTTEKGGAFKVSKGATLTGTDVVFKDNAAANGGAIYTAGTVALTNAVFKGNTADYGGAIYNGGGTLSLDDVTFEGNTAAKLGGAIANFGTVHFDGPVMLVTTNDTIQNTGMLNWNLAGGKAGQLNGYDKLTNGGKLRLTVEDYAAMPTNFVIATGEFSNVEGKDTFSITNVDQQAAMITGVTINGSLVGNEEGTVGYKLVTVPAGETTNLVFNVYELTDRTILEAGASTNLVEHFTYTAQPTKEYGGVFCVNEGATLTGTDVTFSDNETTKRGGGAICNNGGTVALTNAVFEGNKAVYGGAIYNFGTLSLDGVTFTRNEAEDVGGAIGNFGATLNLDGPVMLVTATDTIYNFGGTLNWNLADGKAGLLNGYDKLTNDGGTLRLTIDDALVAPTNFVIATGDLEDVEGKDTFSITNVTSGATATIQIGELILLEGDWWKLAIEGTNLVFSALETAKLSNVEIIDAETGVTNATAVVTVGGIAVEQNEDGSFTVPQGEELTLAYTAADGFMFGPGWTKKTVTLEGLKGDYPMTAEDKPAAEPTWADVREIDFDTRERIVVGVPEEVLPVAYSTNFWGTVAEAKGDDWVNVFVGPETLVDRSHASGYAEWMPAYEAYGIYKLDIETAHAYTNAFVYYSQPFALTLQQTTGGTIAATANTADAKAGTVLGYDFVNVKATEAEGYVFTGWLLATNGVDVTAEFFAKAEGDPAAAETRFEMPCEAATLTAKFTAKTGCEVNGTDIAVGKGAGWEYTPAANGKMGTLEINSDEVYKIVLSGKLPSHTTVTAKPSEEPMLQIFNLNNFTNDVSDCDGAVALTVPAFRFGNGPVGIEGTNYLAAGAYASAIQVVGQTVTFSGTGSLTALPGTAETVLPAISCIDGGTCKITKGTYNDAVDPDLVYDERPDTSLPVPHAGAFSNGDGTWTVKQYWQVTFDPVPPGESPTDYWMDANDMTQRVVKGECAIPPAPPKCYGRLFSSWENTDGHAEYDFAKEVKKDLNLQATYYAQGVGCATHLTDPVTMRQYAAGDLSNAVERVEEGGVVMVVESGLVCNDIEKQMLISYTPDSGAPTVTAGEGLAFVNSVNDNPQHIYYGYGIIAVGEMVKGTDTSLVVVKGEAMPRVASIITEKPKEGITKELVEAATNFVGTVTAENLRALPADAMYPMAVDKVKGTADAIRTQIKLDVVAWGLVPSAKKRGTLASVEMEITPMLEVYRVKNGELETSPVTMYKPSSLQMSGKPATVTFSVAALGQVPMLVEHELTSGDVEYFYHPDDVKPGEKAFAYDPVAKTLSLEMASFSPVTVYFELDQFPVVLQAGAGGYFGEPGFNTRKVYESTTGTGKYRHLVTPTSAKGGDFGGWYVNSTKTVANGDDFAKASAHSLAAKWLYEQPVTVVAHIGGMATGSGSYRIGSSVTVAAKPYDNWQFRDWSGYPLAGETRNPATFTMPANPVVLTANFEVSDACRAACADQVMADRDAALAELGALALTDDERAAFAADIDTAAATAIVAIAAAKTPDAAFASVTSAAESFADTLDEAGEVVDGRSVAFAATTYKATEGEALDVAVFGGKVDRTTSVTLDFVKGTYAAKPTVYVDGVKAKFPLALTWARGEVGEKVVTLVTKATKVAEEDRFFTLQLSAPAGIELGEAQVATVTVSDQTGPAPSETDYVRALAWPANGGTASGSGELKLKRSGVCRTLRASPKKYATFAGWYLAKADDANQIDTNALVTVEKTLKVGLGTPYGAGTYYAYFVDVLPVASVVDPDETSEEAEGVVYSDGVYRLNVGVPVSLPIGLDDESGKGSLSVSSLPSGLRYNRKEGLIEGTPVKAGVKTVKAVAKNAAGKQTVYYTFDVEPLPANAVGTWNGLVRPLSDDGTHAGCGSVQFTAASSGKLSAKVTTRLTGTKSFSAKSYERIDENTFGVTMATRKGEVFEATLSLTNGWTEAQLSGTVTGGAFEENGEEVRFTAIRNAFDKKDKNQEALDLLSEYKGEYEEALYLRADGTEAGSVVFVVKDGGKVQVKAKSVNGSYSATCAGAFRATPAGRGAVEAAVRSGYKLWAADALLDAETGDAAGLACDYATDGEDTHETIGTPANETEIRIRGLK